MTPQTPEQIAGKVEAALTRLHDTYMNKGGFFRDSSGNWQRVKLDDLDQHATAQANAIYNARYTVRAILSRCEAS